MPGRRVFKRILPRQLVRKTRLRHGLDACTIAVEKNIAIDHRDTLLYNTPAVVTWGILHHNQPLAESRRNRLYGTGTTSGNFDLQMTNYIKALPDPPEGSLQIRAAVVADVPALFALRMDALQRHPEVFSSDPSKEHKRGPAFWEQRISNVDHGVIYIATDGLQIAAMTGIYREEQTKLQHIANVSGVYVRPQNRGQGAATRLIHACIAWARERDLKVIKLAVVTTNGAAIRCYTNAGFRVYGVEPKALQHDGVFYDELLMALEF